MNKRTKAGQKEYDLARSRGETNIQVTSKGEKVFDLSAITHLREWDNWIIIPARYPYDAIFEVHHLLIPKRAFSFLREATDEEEQEYYMIKKELDEEGEYHSIIENFSNSRSVIDHYHAHLARWISR